MMQEQDLHELAEFVSEGGSVLSLYLHIDPQRRSADETKLSLRRLLAQAAEQGASPADVERVERFFEHEYDRQGRAVALFSCQARKFWRGYTLLVPVRSTCYVGSRPYITPLSDLWDNYGRVGVILVDRGGARLFVYHLGALEDSVGTMGEEVKHHKQGGWAAQKLQRYEDQEARHNLKEAAAWADGYLNQHHVERLVLAGTPENLAEFRGLLPRSLQDKVVGQTSLDTNASPAEAWERAFEVAQAEQRQAEENLLEQVITAALKGGAGALGLNRHLDGAAAGPDSPVARVPRPARARATVHAVPGGRAGHASGLPVLWGPTGCRGGCCQPGHPGCHRRRPEGVGVGSQRPPGRGRRDCGGAAVLRRGTYA